MNSLKIWIEQLEAETKGLKKLLRSGSTEDALRQACLVVELQTAAITALLNRRLHIRAGM